MKASLSDHKQQGTAVMKGERPWMASHCPGLRTVSHEREKKPCRGHWCLKAVQQFPHAHELEAKFLTHTLHSSITWVSYFATSSNHKMMPSMVLEGAWRGGRNLGWEEKGGRKCSQGRDPLLQGGCSVVYGHHIFCVHDCHAHYYRFKEALSHGQVKWINISNKAVQAALQTFFVICYQPLLRFVVWLKQY